MSKRKRKEPTNLRERLAQIDRKEARIRKKERDAIKALQPQPLKREDLISDYIPISGLVDIVCGYLPEPDRIIAVLKENPHYCISTVSGLRFKPEECCFHKIELEQSIDTKSDIQEARRNHKARQGCEESAINQLLFYEPQTQKASQSKRQPKSRYQKENDQHEKQGPPVVGTFVTYRIQGDSYGFIVAVIKNKNEIWITGFGNHLLLRKLRWRKRQGQWENADEPNERGLYDVGILVNYLDPNFKPQTVVL